MLPVRLNSTFIASLFTGKLPERCTTGTFLYPVPLTTAPLTLKILRVLVVLPTIVIIPLSLVVVLSSKESSQAVTSTLLTSALSINILVTEPIVALLYLMVPMPGSASVMVVLKVKRTPPLLPVNP